MVMKLLTEVEGTNPFSKQPINVKLGGCAGYVPVFNTLKEAKKHAEKGKYKIGLIRVGE